MRSVRLPVAIAVLVASVMTLEAARVRRLTLSEVRDGAAVIVVGEVTGVATRVGETGNMVWTDYQLRLSETLRGRAAGQLMTLSFAGGRAGGLDVGIGGVPKLERGKRYVFFVNGDHAQAMPTVGWGQGLFSIEEVSEGTTKRELLLSADGEPLEVTARGELTRATPSSMANGALVSVAQQGASKRLAKPRAFNADGSTRALRPARPVEVRRARLATLSDLRAFTLGRMGEARRPVQR